MKCCLAYAMAVLGMNLWTAKLAMVITHARACVTAMAPVRIAVLLTFPATKGEKHTQHGHSQDGVWCTYKGGQQPH